MVKIPPQHLLSRRRFLIFGMSTATAIGVLGLAQLKVLSYLIYPFKSNRKFTIIGKSSLKQRAERKGLIYGAYPQAESQQFAKDRQLQSVFLRECALLTIGCYWSVTRPSASTFNFAEPDYFAKFAAKHQLQLRGHPLVWHEALPQWLPTTLTSQNAEQILTHHIDTLARRYAGRMYSWDVVNEAIDLGDNRADGLRNTPWLKFLGSDYIDLAFRLTAKADPRAKLVYNEFGVEYDTPGDDAKREAVLNLLQQLKSQGTPIYALGIQSHLSGDRQNANFHKFRSFLKSVANLGLKIMITELDVTDDKLPLDFNKRDLAIAGIYEDYLSVALAEKAVISVANWGLSDRYTWLSGFRPRADKANVRPLPFDRDYRPKLVHQVIARAFDRAPFR
jgi:endo-1,4-beta-xylanase